MASTLGFALLGLLARQPLSGYDIAAQLAHGVGPFWHARHSQVYPELARLQAAGLVSHEHIEQHDRPDKKVFSVTPAGHAALREWVGSALDPSPIRDEITLRAYSVWLADQPRAAALFRDQERLHRERLAEYQGYALNMEQAGQAGPPRAGVTSAHFAQYATLRRGIAHERELAAWCGWLADALEGSALAPDADGEQQPAHQKGEPAKRRDGAQPGRPR